MDYLKLYWLESYLFDTVRHRFEEQGFLTAFDFFCIVSWKAGRAKPRVAHWLRGKGHSDLKTAVSELTSSLAKADSPKERLRILMECWTFTLPMATAVLTVLYPEEFTAYDSRVCESLKAFQNLVNLKYSEKLWKGYQDFKREVQDYAPSELTLRDKDRYLWGKSWYEQLRRDIGRGFQPSRRASAAPKPTQSVAKF